MSDPTWNEQVRAICDAITQELVVVDDGSYPGSVYAGMFRGLTEAVTLITDQVITLETRVTQLENKSS